MAEAVPDVAPSTAPGADTVVSVAPLDASSIVSSDLLVINWEQAMSQVSDDIDFLKEVLSDLIDESMTAKSELIVNIEKKHFENVMKAAHRIKGSASYLCVDRMREISLHMQMYGHAGKEMEQDEASIAKHAANLKIVPANVDEIWGILSTLFEQFQVSIDDLKAAISERFPDDATVQ
jgi:HPt (histidine-containing phosphotransfer) domain-containing protein